MILHAQSKYRRTEVRVLSIFTIVGCSPNPKLIRTPRKRCYMTLLCIHLSHKLTENHQDVAQKEAGFKFGIALLMVENWRPLHPWVPTTRFS